MIVRSLTTAPADPAAGLTGSLTATVAVAALAVLALATVGALELLPGGPRLEGRLVLPAGHHQPGGPPVGGAQQLEALEARLAVHRAGTGGEAAGQLVAGDLSTVPLLQGAQVAVTGKDVSGVTLDASFKLRFAPITK